MTQISTPRVERTRIAVFTTRSNQAIRIPKSMSFPGVTELEAQREGDVLTLRPARPSWESFFALEPIDDDFLTDRPDVIESREIDFGD